MTVFSSLQTLAEKYEEAKWHDIIEADAKDELGKALVDAWPLLEAAVKALEELVRDDVEHQWRHRPGVIDATEAALSSLTGEPR